MKTPEEYIELIDKQYSEAKKERIPRVDIKWGMWSAEMNRETRKYTKEHPREELSEYYNLVYGYWVVTSQLLDLHYQRKVYSRQEYPLPGNPSKNQLHHQIKGHPIILGL